MYETTRNRGRFQIELSYGDEEILAKFRDIIKSRWHNAFLTDRTRDTNFRSNYRSSILTAHDLEFRKFMKSCGVGLPKCSVDVPEGVNEKHYFRGYIDGNGSLGFDKKGSPFLSVTIVSDALAESYLGYITQVTGKIHNVNRNSRDNVYNIAIYKEEALQFSEHLYQGATLFLKRKYDSYTQILGWTRPEGMRRVTGKKNWGPSEDLYISKNCVKDSAEHLGRTEKSIKMRLFRLKHGLDYGRKKANDSTNNFQVGSTN